MTDLLEIDGLHAAYGKIVAVRDVSLRVAAGECVAILGANGAGKTTTLDAISGTSEARISGTIRMNGQDLGKLPAHLRVRLGVAHIIEGRGIFTSMSVMENLELGAFSLRSATGSDLHAALNRVLTIFPRLEERLKQRAGSLSGGEQQMLAIGRGLMSGPKVILLDEPSTGLSPAMINLVGEALRQIADEGVGVVLVEQKVEAALRLASRAYVIARGRVVLQGDAADIRDNPGLKEAYLGRD